MADVSKVTPISQAQSEGVPLKDELSVPADVPKKAATDGDVYKQSKAQEGNAGKAAPEGNCPHKHHAHEKRNAGVIDKVKNPDVATNWRVSDEVDILVKMKMMKWDKDENGTFTTEEVQDAMEDLEQAQKQLAGMKWQFIFFFGFIFLFIITAGFTAGIVYYATKDTSVKSDGEIRAMPPENAAKAKRQTEITATTQSRGDINLPDMIQFDPDTDQWLIDDDALRELDTVSFWGKNLSFYTFDLAEVIRTDSGKTGTNDRLEILTTSGVRLRWWEIHGEMEVRWQGTNMWDQAYINTNSTGGRLLGDHHEAFNQESLISFEDEDDEHEDSAEADARRLGKGGVHVYYGGGAHYNRGGRNSNQCQTWCNVPQGKSDTCRNYCGEHQCYRWGHDVYRCNGANAIASALGAALLLLARAFVET